MKRREFITLLGAAATWPAASRAQQTDRVRRIGVLMGGVEGDSQTAMAIAAFKKALQDLGWKVGLNISIDIRWSASNVERMRTLAKELVSLGPDLLFGHTTQPVAALQRETSTIPIVFVVVSDPVGSGFVASLPRPGGNITGFINIEASLGGKWIEVLKEISPKLARAALMFNADTAPYSRYYLEPFEAAAQFRGIEPIAVPVRTPADIERAIASLGDRPDTGLAVMPDTYMATNRTLIISLAARHRVPTIYAYSYYVNESGLVSYGIDQTDLFRRAPAYIDRILKGARPGELPVQLPTRFEMAVNLKTAKALGIEIPAHQSSDGDPAPGDQKHPDRVRICRRSRRQRLRRKPRQTRWQQYRLRQFRELDRRQMAGAVQRDCAQRQACRIFHPDAAPNVGFYRAAQAAAPSLGIVVVALAVHNTTETEDGIAGLANSESAGLIVAPHAVTLGNRNLIVGLAARHRLPAVYSDRSFAESGGLLSFGNNAADMFQRSASYIDRVLKGAKPADLPVQLPTKFELIVNLKTARELGLHVPSMMLTRADEVIE